LLASIKCDWARQGTPDAGHQRAWSWRRSLRSATSDTAVTEKAAAYLRHSAACRRPSRQGRYCILTPSSAHPATLGAHWLGGARGV